MTEDPVAPEPARGAEAGRGGQPDRAGTGDRDRSIAGHRAGVEDVPAAGPEDEPAAEAEGGSAGDGADGDGSEGESAGDGDGADGDDAPTEDEGPGETVAPSVATRRLGRLAGIVAFAYVAWYVVGLVVLDTDPARYNALNRATGNLTARLLLAGVLLALVFHLLDGLRVAIEDLVPGVARRDLQLRVGVRFLVPALWIPGALVLVWPAVRSWFSW